MFGFAGTLSGRIAGLAIVLTLLFTGTANATTPQIPEADDETAIVAVPEPTPDAVHFYQTGIPIWLGATAWAIAIPALIAFSGLSARMRNLARRVGRYWFPTIALYGVLYLLLTYVIDLPLAYFAGFVRAHAYGLSRQSFPVWMGKSLTALGVELVLAVLFLWVPLLILKRAPRRWWLYVGLLTLPFGLASAMLKPVWIDPLFNKFGPMHDKALEARILDLAARAGIEGSRVFEVDKSKDTTTVNAYVTGFAGTKRIVLWDTLLQKLEDREVLVVMAHEMGHYVRNHVVIGITLSTFGAIALLDLVHRLAHALLGRFPRRLGFDSLSDVAAVPLMVCLLQGLSFASSPITLAIGRAIEHDADVFALNLTHANHSGAMAFVKLAQENLSYPRPDTWVKWMRSTHPPIGERIDFCNKFHPWR